MPKAESSVFARWRASGARLIQRHPVARYLTLKVGRAVFVIWATFTATFVLLYVFPADPVDLLVDPAAVGQVRGELREQLAATYGFDKPPLEQYLDRLGHALTGDFGNSVTSGKPVGHAIAETLPHTLVLAALALGAALLIAFALAVGATATRRPWLRNFLTSLPSAAVSIPSFMVAILLLQVFAFTFGWFPAFGDQGWRTMVLPVATLALPVSGPIAQLLIRSFEAELGASYIATSRAKGATRTRILTGDVFRNASLPALTIAGIVFGNLIAGSVITETVFSRQGVGRLTQTAISSLDVPLVQGVVVLVAAAFAAINLAVDLLYPLLDPRIRVSLAQGSAPAGASA
ncbi:MAG: ABC transporter permease [Bifidobacteriaceae bacterium]|jgi:peptide/nickel transport system permease protein|nr:ABC transporter permease [Bifidobacteriaceae bacterium]